MNLKNLETRIIGLVLMLSGLLYLSWLLPALNFQEPIFAIFFFITAVFGVVSSFLLVINNWSWDVPKFTPLNGSTPQVAVIIPTWKEEPEMVQKTIESIILQDYPMENVLVIVTDDAVNPLMQAMINRLLDQHPKANIAYNLPPEKDDPARKGEGKAGNLNSALELVAHEPTIKYVETRDADDLVGSQNFLRIVLGQLENNEKLAYVQTVKDVITSKSDPFGNREKLFYRSLMLSKNSANAVFPCGSGLVWRKDALLSIGGFPVWNIVEDFQSGAEALRKGWKAQFLPIVGAVGQVAPEDIPNVYKQRAVWAMDSIRFLLWGNKKGLSLRQRLHFSESGLFYIASGVFFLQALIPVFILLFGVKPVLGDPIGYALHLTPHILALYLFVLSLMRRQDISFGEVIRSLQIAFGLGPLYLGAFLKTLAYGRDKKPNYIVTRKYNKGGLYLFSTKAVLLMAGLLVYASIKPALDGQTPAGIDWMTIVWSGAYVYMFARIIRNSWFGWRPFFKRQTQTAPVHSLYRAPSQL